MGLQDSLARLMDKVGDHAHDYHPSIMSYLEFNTDKVARDLKISDRGRERGERNEPPDKLETVDAVENEILERIENEVRKAHAAVLEDLTTYAQRLHALDLEGRFSTIEAAAMDGISSFRSEVSRGHDRLSSQGRRVRDLEQEMRDFKTDHKLKRTAHYPDSFGKALRFGIVALMFMFEFAGNTYFLAKGSAYGIIGGFAEAVLIAFLNIGGSLAFGHFGVRQLWHRALLRKLSGLLSLGAWLLFCLALNLLVAHYREASGAFLEGGGAVALNSLKENPFGLTDIQSWVLFGIGALFAFIALVDVLSIDDLYPFYGKLDRTLDESRAAYAEERGDLIADLEAIKSEATLAMQQAKDDLNKRRGEYGSILESRLRATRVCEQHLDNLERAANTLLSIYYEANRAARSDPSPERFGQKFTITRPLVEAEQPTDLLPKEQLQAAVERAQESLDTRMKEVHDEFEKAFRTYPHLEDHAGGHGG